MCSSPKVPKSKTKDEKPEWLRNPYLDAAVGKSSSVDQLRIGRSALRTDLNKTNSLTIQSAQNAGMGQSRAGSSSALPTISAAASGGGSMQRDRQMQMRDAQQRLNYLGRSNSFIPR